MKNILQFSAESLRSRRLASPLAPISLALLLLLGGPRLGAQAPAQPAPKPTDPARPPAPAARPVIPVPGIVEPDSEASPSAGNPSQLLLDAIAYNEDVPPLVTDPDTLKALKLHGSQWLQQSLIWPSKLERRIHAGISTYDQRAALVSWLDAALQFRPMPSELLLNAVEMRGWLVLYSDWAREVGADAFIVRITNKGYAIHITESETNIIIALRPERATDTGGRRGVDLAMFVAEDFLRQYLLPLSRDNVIAQESPVLAGGIEGTWQPAGQGVQRRPLADEAPPLAIRFFAIDDFVAFNFNKMLWQQSVSPTLYTKRFDPPLDQQAELDIIDAIQEETIGNARFTDPAERIIFYQRLQRQLNIKTVEEFLGPMLYDSTGQPLTSQKLDYSRVMSAVDRLNQDQRNLLMRQRRVDIYYVEGLKAFENNDLEMSIDQWSRALAVDPTNVRIGVLLQVVLDIKIERDFAGNSDAARRDQVIDNIRELLAYHRQTVLRSAVAEAETERREREIYELRAKGIELYQKNLFAESIAIWQRILRLDPTNATASLWLATLEAKQHGMDLPNVSEDLLRLGAATDSSDRPTTSPAPGANAKP